VGNPESVSAESFRDGLLEEPQYTRPAEYRGWSVPEVLLSGDHGKVEAWRRRQRLERTRARRPDLIEEQTEES
jgi:tRNA (guanine37-N1)-methyltransferase